MDKLKQLISAGNSLFLVGLVTFIVFPFIAFAIFAIVSMSATNVLYLIGFAIYLVCYFLFIKRK